MSERTRENILDRSCRRLTDHPALCRYAAAVMLILLATGVRYLLDGVLGDALPFLAHLVAIVFIAWVGGLGPTLVGTALGAVVVSWLFIPPRGSVAVGGAEGVLAVAMFFFVGLSSALISEAQKKALRRAEMAAGDAQRRLAERNRAEQAQRDSEARAQSILVTAVDAIITMDEHGRIDSLNPAAERLFGYVHDEIIGQNASILMASPERDAHDRYLEQYIRTGQARIIGIGREVTARHKDGTTFPVKLAVSEMWVGGRRMFTGIIHDITSQKQAENDLRAAKELAEASQRQAEAANRTKDEFLATLSHELRTPLNAILGWSRLLREGDLDEETGHQAADIIERNAMVQAQLVEDLLDVSRITSGKLRLESRPVDLKDVIDAAIASARPAAEARGIRLVRILDPQAGPVMGDPTRLQQIVWNLLSNAIKFTPRSGRVQIQLQRADSNIAIVVNDTGKGISRDFLPHLFQRFRQADSSITRTYGGLGLGLAIVRHLVEMHGGAVEAHSDGEGKGATFTVKLPLLAVRNKPDQQARSADSLKASPDTLPLMEGMCVLVVDDDPDACQLIRTVLERCKAEVVTAHSVNEAIRAMRHFVPDVMISDIGMPGDDGYNLIRRVRALPPEQGGQVPAMALTAYARAEDRMRILTAGYQMHVPKPVEPAELAAIVASLAGRTVKHPSS